MSGLKSLKAENFTAFKDISLGFNKGINIFIGSNGTGKTHILKCLYAACSITSGSDRDQTFGQKLVGVFHPYENRPGRLSFRGAGSVTSKILVTSNRGNISAEFSNHTQSHSGIEVKGEKLWKSQEINCAYIPVKEMLAHAPGFLALSERRELSFEDVYKDIIYRAYLPRLKGPTGEKRRNILEKLREAIEGNVTIKGDNFFLKNKQGNLEFTLLSEGMRKLALIWILTQNGVLTNGSILFWDEPEANLNPSRMGEVVDVMLELQRLGVQIFVSTHNYVVIKEFELRRKQSDSIFFTALFRDSDGIINSESSLDFKNIMHNKISETYNSLYDREVENSMSRLKFD